MLIAALRRGLLQRDHPQASNLCLLLQRDGLQFCKTTDAWEGTMQVQLLDATEQSIKRAGDRIAQLRWHVMKLELAGHESDGARRVLLRRELALKRMVLYRAVLSRHPAVANAIPPEFARARAEGRV